MKRMGFLGPRGTHSEAAVLWLIKNVVEKRELVRCSDIYDVLRAVEDGELDCGLVPVENSLEGSINITLDTLARSDRLTVSRELIWRIHNQLMARDGVKEIKKIISHAQPLSQCRRYIQQHYPKAEIEAVQSTARAAELASTATVEEGIAAICTARAGELYNLSTIAPEIQDNIFNSTRFFEIIPPPARPMFLGRNRAFFDPTERPLAPSTTTALPSTTIEPTIGDKVLIICQIHGERPGALCEVLEEFAFRNVNMMRIESRPARTKLGEYIFFFELDTNAPRGMLAESIAAVRRKAITLKVLGPFPVIAAVD